MLDSAFNCLLHLLLFGDIALEDDDVVLEICLYLLKVVHLKVCNCYLAAKAVKIANCRFSEA